MTPSIDGKLIYASSGEVIDIASRKVVGIMKDEYGRVMHSEKLLDMVFAGGKLTQVSNQFANGFPNTTMTSATTTASK